MFDIISVFCWGAVYLLIIFSCKCQQGEYKRAIPLVPALLNLSWETVAVVYCEAFWGHLLWFSLSIMVFESNLQSIKKKKWQALYALLLAVGMIVFSLIFIHEEGMLISSFVINAIMSLAFILDRSNLLPKRKVQIAVLKFVGSVAATVGYARYSMWIIILGTFMFICDAVYIVLCIREKRESAVSCVVALTNDAPNSVT